MARKPPLLLPFMAIVILSFHFFKTSLSWIRCITFITCITRHVCITGIICNNDNEFTENPKKGESLTYWLTYSLVSKYASKSDWPPDAAGVKMPWGGENTFQQPLLTSSQSAHIK